MRVVNGHTAYVLQRDVYRSLRAHMRAPARFGLRSRLAPASCNPDHQP